MLKRVNEKTNGAKEAIEAGLPYTASVTIEGAADLLFHRWNSEAVDEKARSAKGSKAKKSDNVETYVYRNDKNEICLPGEYLRMAIIMAAKFRQDPRSPRKSAMDLFKAGVVSTTPLAPIFSAERLAEARLGEQRPGRARHGMAASDQWDYLDVRRVMIQRNGINRTRPAMKAGWRATFDLLINLPEYIDRNSLRETIEQAGRLIGVGDFRPTFGRFGIVAFEECGQ